MKYSCHNHVYKFYSLETHLVVCNSTYTSQYNYMTDVRLGMQYACSLIVIHYLSLREPSGQY